MKKLYNFLIPLFSIACIILLWVVVSISSNGLYPSIGEVVSAFFSLLKRGEFYSALFGTILRSFIAFLISFSLAFVLAGLSKYFNFANRFIKPFIVIIRTLPTVAVVLLLLFFTSSFIAPIIVTILVVLPILFQEITISLNAVDNQQIMMCRAFNVSEKQIIKRVFIPQIMPDLLSSIGSGLSLNLKLMVAAEVLAHTAKSIGYYMNLSSQYDQIATMLALVIFTVVLGLLIDWIFSLISKKVGRWK